MCSLGYCCPVYTSGNQGAHTRKRTSPFSPSPRSFRSGPPCFSYLVNILGALQVLGVDPECRAITCGAQPFPSTLLVLGGDWSSGSGPGLGAVSGSGPGLGAVVVGWDWAQWLWAGIGRSGSGPGLGAASGCGPGLGAVACPRPPRLLLLYKVRVLPSPKPQNPLS